MKIKKSDVSLFLMTFISLKIGCISYFSSILNMIWYLLQTLMIIYLLISTVYNKNINKLDLCVILFHFILFVITLLNHGDIDNLIKSIITFFSLWFVMKCGLENNAKNYIKFMSFLLFLYTFINTFTSVILFPNALFRDNNAPVFFMGADNTSVRIYIFSVCFWYLNSFIKNKKIKYPFLPIINFLIFSFVRDLGGGKTCCFLISFLLIYLNYFSKRIKRVAFKTIVSNIILFLIMVVFNRLNIFSFFIENVLHRDLTLTYRTIIWKVTINKIMESPIIGYGMISGKLFEAMLPYIIGINAHNTYLMILFNGGIILFIVFIYTLLISSHKFDSLKHFKFIYIIPLSLLTLMIRAQIEGWDVEWIFLLLLMLYLSEKIECCVNGEIK